MSVLRIFCPFRTHAEDGVPGLRSANSYSLRPGTPPSAETMRVDTPLSHGGGAAYVAGSAGSGAAHAVNKNWLNGVGGPTSGCVCASNPATPKQLPVRTKRRSH